MLRKVEELDGLIGLGEHLLERKFHGHKKLRQRGVFVGGQLRQDDIVAVASEFTGRRSMGGEQVILFCAR